MKSPAEWLDGELLAGRRTLKLLTGSGAPGALDKAVGVDAEVGTGTGCPIRLTLNDRGDLSPPCSSVRGTGTVPFRITTNPLFAGDGVGASTPANNAPLSAANTALRALFSSLACSATSSILFCLPRPRAIFQPLFFFSTGDCRGSNASGALYLRRDGPGSLSDPLSSGTLVNQLDGLLTRLFFFSSIGSEYVESGEVSSLRLFKDRRRGMVRAGGRRP